MNAAKVTHKQAKQIAVLMSKLTKFEVEDPDFMTHELKELRNQIFRVHLALDISSDLALAGYLREPFKNHNHDFRNGLLFLEHSHVVTSEMDFARKIKVLKKSGLIKNDLPKILLAVNQMRKEFAHPSAFSKEIQEYNDPQKYIEALKLLIRAYEEFDYSQALKRMFKSLNTLTNSETLKRSENE